MLQLQRSKKSHTHGVVITTLFECRHCVTFALQVDKQPDWENAIVVFHFLFHYPYISLHKLAGPLPAMAELDDGESCYEILGVDPGSTPSEIRQVLPLEIIAQCSHEC